jgi:hypothetical protein
MLCPKGARGSTMTESNKRQSDRKKVVLTSYIRKEMADGNSMLMQFLSKDLSATGIFIISEDLSIFDLGDEITLIVDKEKVQYYEGRAKVVRSARVIEVEGAMIESGFGLMFLDPGEAFIDMVKKEVENAPADL